jgi:hypothetical protein
MLATVILGTGPQKLHIDPLPGDPDGLAIIRKWKDDFWAFSIVAPVESLEHPELGRSD